MDSERKWNVIASTTEYAGNHLSVVSERVRTPGHPAVREWTIVRRKSAVVIAPMTADGRFVLINQERIPIHQSIWEMPAGQVDEVCDAGSLREVAVRELREETGYELLPKGEMIYLGDFFSSPGFTDEREFLFLARLVQPSPQGHAHSPSESILLCQEFSPAEIKGMIADGTICDANTLSIWARLVARNLVQVAG